MNYSGNDDLAGRPAVQYPFWKPPHAWRDRNKNWRKLPREDKANGPRRWQDGVLVHPTVMAGRYENVHMKAVDKEGTPYTYNRGVFRGISGPHYKMRGIDMAETPMPD